MQIPGDPTYKANLDGMVLRQVLAFSKSAGGSFKVGDYPWLTYVFVALPGTDGADPERYMMCCHRLGVTTVDGKRTTIIGLWGFPENSPADDAYIAARRAGNAHAAVRIGQMLSTRASDATAVHVQAAGNGGGAFTFDPSVTAGGASAMPTTAVVTSAGSGGLSAPIGVPGGYSTFTVGGEDTGGAFTVNVGPLAR